MTNQGSVDKTVVAQSTFRGATTYPKQANCSMMLGRWFSLVSAFYFAPLSGPGVHCIFSLHEEALDASFPIPRCVHT
jgi:hypothetical protein